jgi:xanthine dehydrogenase accessory factor
LSTREGLWQHVADELAARRSCVVATVVRHGGSVPRRTGAKMLVYADGQTRDTVGGGIFEQVVVRDALTALRNRQSATREYSFTPGDEVSANESSVVKKIENRQQTQTFGAVCGGRVEVFLEVVVPPDKLLIVGGGHCGRALAEAASLLGFSITLVDDRAEFAQPDEYSFPGVEAVLQMSSEFADLPLPDEHTFVALVSKGYPTDEAALRRIIDAPAAYIGMIGSKRKRETVFANLRASGIAEEKLARVHAPIGLDIGAETPQEIAISILAEIVQVRAQGCNAAQRGNAAQGSKVQSDADE